MAPRSGHVLAGDEADVGFLSGSESAHALDLEGDAFSSDSREGSAPPARTRLRIALVLLAGLACVALQRACAPNLPRPPLERGKAESGLSGPPVVQLEQVFTKHHKSCRDIGCFRKYDKTLFCQCNDECHRYHNCCHDYLRTCQEELPEKGKPGAPPATSPPPKSATKPHHKGKGATLKEELGLAKALQAAAMKDGAHGAAPTPLLAPKPTPPPAHAPAPTPEPTPEPTPAPTPEPTPAPTPAPPPPPPPPAPTPKPKNHDNVPKCRSPEECLKAVDRFMDSQPRHWGLLRWDKKLGGQGPCGNDCKARGPCPDGRCGLSTYDNALAAIYYTKRGQYSRARNILNAFRRALYPEDLRLLRPRVPEALYVGRLSRQALTLLAASYAPGYKPVPGNYETPYVTDGSVDAGTNAWVALAFAHYASAAGYPCFANIAREILDALAKTGTCQEDRWHGYMAELPPGKGTFRSTERNVVIYAAAHLLGNERVKSEAGHFVRSMHGANAAAQSAQAYVAGSGNSIKCDANVPAETSLPAAANFWTILADADSLESRMNQALKFALQSPHAGADGRPDSQGLWVKDRDMHWMGGAGPRPIFHGFRETNNAAGVHWEVTASGVMALLHAKSELGGEGHDLQKFVDEAQGSLSKLLVMYNGVPAFVADEAGVGVADERYLTVAATAWTGLLYLYQANATGGSVNKDANPFAIPGKGVPTSKATCWKQE